MVDHVAMATYWGLFPPFAIPHSCYCLFCLQVQREIRHMGCQKWFKQQVLNLHNRVTPKPCTPQPFFQDPACNLAILRREGCCNPVTPICSRLGFKAFEKMAFSWKMQPCQNWNALQTCVGCAENVILKRVSGGGMFQQCWNISLWHFQAKHFNFFLQNEFWFQNISFYIIYWKIIQKFGKLSHLLPSTWN